MIYEILPMIVQVFAQQEIVIEEEQTIFPQ